MLYIKKLPLKYWC